MSESIKNERVEGEHYFAKCHQNNDVWTIFRRADGKIVRVVLSRLSAQTGVDELDETATHFIEQGIQTERNRQSDGEDGAAGLLREIVAAFDQTTFIAAEAFLATQPDTPAETLTFEDEIDGKWESGDDTELVEGLKNLTPTDPEDGPYFAAAGAVWIPHDRPDPADYYPDSPLSEGAEADEMAEALNAAYAAGQSSTETRINEAAERLAVFEAVHLTAIGEWEIKDGEDSVYGPDFAAALSQAAASEGIKAE